MRTSLLPPDKGFGYKVIMGTASVSATKTGVASDVGFTQLSFGNMASQTQNPANWAAVPEPTSGLLMLLGMAGLALRRRRA